MNFIPKMNRHELLEGYNKIIKNIYAVKPYYKRLRKLLINYKRSHSIKIKINFPLLRAFFKSIIIIGILNRGRREFWKLIIWTLFYQPGSIVDAVTYTIYGYHFRTIYGLRNKDIFLRSQNV